MYDVLDNISSQTRVYEFQLQRSEGGVVLLRKNNTQRLRVQSFVIFKRRSTAVLEIVVFPL